MKLQLNSRRNSERGFTAIIVALVLVSVLGILAVSNGVALRHLKMELDLVEERQWRRHAGERLEDRGGADKGEEAGRESDSEVESELNDEEEEAEAVEENEL
jgi:hypothetical protein